MKFREMSNTWIFERELHRLIQQNDAVFATPRDVLDYLLLEVDRFHKKANDRREGIGLSAGSKSNSGEELSK